MKRKGKSRSKNRDKRRPLCLRCGQPTGDLWLRPGLCKNCEGG